LIAINENLKQIIQRKIKWTKSKTETLNQVN
jgi:hypothetical protein